MLAKTSRLNIKKNFKFVVAGQRRETTNFKLYFRVSDNKQPLVGVSVSKKMFRKATDRNRAKRKCFGAVESHLKRLPSAMNLVIMPKASILSQSIEALEEELASVKDLYKSN